MPLPAIPTLLNLGQTTTTIVVGWNQMSGVTFYGQIRRAGTTATPWSDEVEVTSPYTFRGLDDDTSYQIRLRAEGVGGQVYTPIATRKTIIDLPAPKVTSTFSRFVTRGSRNFREYSVRWDRIPGATGYEYKRTTSSSITSTTSTVFSALVGTSSSSSVDYSVRAVSGSVRGPWAVVTVG